MRDKLINLIFNELKSSKYGLTISNLMDRTGLARGTVKSYLVHLLITDSAVEVNYAQNTIVYFAKGSKPKNKIKNSVEVR